MKRVISLVVFICLVIGLFPSGTLGVIAGGNSSKAGISNTALTGDSNSVVSNVYSESTNSIDATPAGITSYVYGILTGTTDDNINANFTSNSLSGYTFDDMVPLANGWVIIGDTVKNKVIIVNAITGEVAKEYKLDTAPRRIDLNPEKGKIIASQKSNNIALIDAITDDIKYMPTSGPAIDVAFAKDNYAAAIISTPALWPPEKISILDWVNGSEIASNNAQSYGSSYIACDRSANNILVGVSGSSPSSLDRFVFNEDAKVLEKKESSNELGSNGQDLTISSDGLHAAFSCGSGNGMGHAYSYTIFDIDPFNIKNKKGEWNTNAYPSSAAFSSDSRYVLATNSYSVQLFNVATHALIKTVTNPGHFRRVWLSNGMKVAFAETEDGTLCSYLISLSNTVTCSNPVYDPSNPQDITASVAGCALNSIKNDSADLTGSDYSISGNSVIIKKSYLTYYFNKFSTPGQKLYLTFHFEGGDDRILTVDMAIVSNSVNCNNPYYDPTNPQDITVNTSGAAFVAVKNGTTVLTPSDYSVSGNAVTIKKSYLSYFFNKFYSQDQKLPLTFDFGSGNDPILIISKMVISNNVTCKNPAFDTSKPQDITVNITGSALVAVKNGSATLTGSDYSISGSAVTIKKSYLNYFFNKFNSPDQKLSLTFDFSSGNDPVLSIRHMIIPYDDSVLTKTTDNINANFTSNSLSGYSFEDMIPLSDGWVIIGDTVKNKVIILNAISGEVAKEYKLDTAPRRIDLNPEKGKIIASQESNNIVLIDAITDEIKYIPTSGSVIDVAFAKDNYAAIMLNGNISIMDWTSGAEVTLFNKLACNYSYIVCDRASNNILVGETGSSPSQMARLEFNEYNKLLEIKESVWNAGTNGKGLDISSDGLHAVFPCGGGNGDSYALYDIDATNINNHNGEWKFGAYPVSAAFSKDSKYLIATNTSSLQLFTVSTHALVKTIADHGMCVKKVGISNGKKIAFAYTEDGRLCSFLIAVSNAITCSNPVYDPSNPQDIAVNVAGYALNAIKNGTASLTSSDYSISGNTVIIKKSYLTYFFNKFNTPGQKLNLTFHFESGYDQALTVSQMAVSNSITCNNAFYDPTNPQDIAVNITGAAFSAVKNGTATLTNSDYSVSGNTVTIKKSYLSYFFSKFNSPNQTLSLTFDFTTGNDPSLAIIQMAISNTVACKNPAFDTSNPRDITVNVTGAALVAVKNGSSALTSSDFSVSGSTVTIKKSYLTYFFNKFNSPDQKLQLTFDFSIGNDPVLSVRRIIIPYDNSVLTKATDNINANFTYNYLSGYTFSDMVPLSDGWVIASNMAKNEVLVVNAISGEIAKEYKLNAAPERIDFNPEKGKIIASQQSSNNIAIIDALTDEIKYIPTSGPAIDVAFAKDNYAAAIISTGDAWWDKKISILDWINGAELAFIDKQSEDYYYIVCDRATNNILVGVSDTIPSSLTRFVFNEETKILDEKEYVRDMGVEGSYGLTISSDGLHAAFPSGGGNGNGYTVFDIDATNINNKKGEWNTGPFPRSAAFSRDNKYLIATNGSLIQLFDVKTHSLIKTIISFSYQDQFRIVGISNGGKIAYAITYGGKLCSCLISGM